MSIPPPDDDDIAADLSAEVPLEANEADTVEQRTPQEEAAPAAGGEAPTEADEGDVAESAQEVNFPDDEDEPTY